MSIFIKLSVYVSVIDREGVGNHVLAGIFLSCSQMGVNFGYTLFHDWVFSGTTPMTNARGKCHVSGCVARLS